MCPLSGVERFPLYSEVFNVNGRAIGTSPLIEAILYMYGFSC